MAVRHKASYIVRLLLPVIPVHQVHQTMPIIWQSTCWLRSAVKWMPENDLDGSFSFIEYITLYFGFNFFIFLQDCTILYFVPSPWGHLFLPAQVYSGSWDYPGNAEHEYRIQHGQDTNPHRAQCMHICATRERFSIAIPPWMFLWGGRNLWEPRGNPKGTQDTCVYLHKQ